MKSRISVIISMLILAGLLTVASPQPASAAYECASWGCAETVHYYPAGGSGKYRIDDKWVDAAWWMDQDDVTACTTMYVRRKSNGWWYYVGSDCGGEPDTVYFDFNFEINSVQIRSRDWRGRWRYKTIDGYSYAP